MINPMDPRVVRYNQYYKELERLYQQHIKKLGMSETAFWIFYSIYESDVPYTQKTLCEDWFYTKQTINSALKNMEQQGWICLKAVPGNRKKKEIFLTEEGNSMVEQYILPLAEAEKKTFERMADEVDTYLGMMKRHIELFQEEVEKL